DRGPYRRGPDVDRSGGADAEVRPCDAAHRTSTAALTARDVDGADERDIRHARAETGHQVGDRLAGRRCRGRGGDRTERSVGAGRSSSGPEVHAVTGEIL